MQRRFDALGQALRGFIDQTRYPTMVLNGRDDDMLVALKYLRSCDHTRDTELYLALTAPFETPSSYLDSAVESIDMQVQAVNKIRKDNGEPPIAPLPLAVQDSRREPQKRLRELMSYGAALVEPALGQAVVWALLPLSIQDQDGYARLVSALVMPAEPAAWMDGHRFLLRDDRAAPFLVAPLVESRAHSVLIFDLDFSTGETLSQLAASVADRTLADGQRMMALLQLAAVDFAYRRYDQAYDKYALLNEYYEQVGDPLRRALCFSGAGDIAMRQDNPKEALKRYQQALALIGPENNLPVLYVLLMSAGASCLELKQYEGAAAYFGQARDTTTRTLNAPGRADALEKLGIAQRELGTTAEAIATWERAREFCEKLEMHQQRHRVLDLLVLAYTDVGLIESARERDMERQSVPRGRP